MAFEQNPYAVKLTLTADTTLSAATQFCFVKLGSSVVVASGLAIASNSAVVTGFTTGASFPAGLVPGSIVTTPAVGLLGAVVTSINPGTGSITLNTIASGTTAALSFTSASFGAGGPVATICAAATDRPLGILQNQPTLRTAASGTVEALAEAEVTVSGVSKVLAGGTITAGAVISVSSTGAAVAITPGTSGSTTSYILGTAITSGVAGDIITVAVNCSASARAA
jgi:hypothetical protein